MTYDHHEPSLRRHDVETYSRASNEPTVLRVLGRWPEEDGAYDI
jgi:hypothetical protein